MNKKLLRSLSVIGAVAAIAVGGTIAYFSNVETSTGNTFTAGTLDLKLDNTDDNVIKFTVGNIVPGSSGTGYWTIKNAGNQDGYVDVQPITLVDDDNACGEAEGDSTCGTTQGELSAHMDVRLF